MSETSDWSGRIDAADGERGRRWHQVVRPVATADRPGVVLLGFASDAGVIRNHGRPGAADGPRTLRRALANLAWHGGDDARLYDAGNVTCEGDQLEDAQADVCRAARGPAARRSLSHWPRRRP